MKKYAKYPALAVTLAIMAVIFVLSSQPAELSTKVSRAVTETVQAGRIKAITPLWFSTTNLNANVRKWAHIYIYCASGGWVVRLLWKFRKKLFQKNFRKHLVVTIKSLTFASAFGNDGKQE